MKKISMILALVAMVFVAGCKNSPKNNAGGEEGTTAAQDSTEAVVENNALTGDLNGHVWVDLGLPSGALWATCNVGATTPADYGDLFAWAETTTKEEYYFGSYKYCDSYSSMTKYNESDLIEILQPVDDAATANWGYGWRTPQVEEMRELADNCTHEWTTQNGVNGVLFKAKNGNQIFLPAAGNICDSNELDGAGNIGFYWSSSLGPEYPDYAWYLYFSSDEFEMAHLYGRCCGFSVRPICFHMVEEEEDYDEE